MRSYVTFYCVHTAHSRYNITSMDDVVVGDPPSILLCKHDCRIVKSTHQHVQCLVNSTTKFVESTTENSKKFSST